MIVPTVPATTARRSCTRCCASDGPVSEDIASIIAGGPAPLIATALLAWTGSGYSVALYVLLSCVISIAATIPLPDYTKCDISEEPVYGLAEGAVSAQAASGG